jgi:hypothetical protein
MFEICVGGGVVIHLYYYFDNYIKLIYCNNFIFI